MERTRLFIAPEGSDAAPGTASQPLQSIPGALCRLREIQRQGKFVGPAEVQVAGGVYHLDAPVVIETDSSIPVTFYATPGERPVFSGGRALEGAQESFDEQGQRVWKISLPRISGQKWYFRSLFVNGERRPRTRLPSHGMYTMEDVPGISAQQSAWTQFSKGTNCFVFQEGDFFPTKNLQDVEVIAHHFWADERMPIREVDFQKRTIVSQVRSVFVLKNDNDSGFASYYFENVREALTQPGQWYLDRESEQLLYLPLPGEELESTHLVAPCLSQFLQIKGCPETGRSIENISFVGLGFEYADWYHTKPLPLKDNEYFLVGNLGTNPLPCATAPQAALHVPGVISLRGTRNCAFINCTLCHVGFYGFEFRDGCFYNTVQGCVIEDTGAGGIRCGGSNEVTQPALHNFGNSFSSNHIFKGGEIFRSGVGILLTHSYRNLIRHNDIHNYYYSAISSGWVWGFADSLSRENLIEFNRIHDLGKRVISDMGGIYILGVQAGTIIRGNHIWNVHARNYGGWGIYLDEGSSYVIVEDNLVHHVSNQCFDQHYGRENIIRNNIFAYAGDCLATIQRTFVNKNTPYWPISANSNNSATFLNNVFVSDGKPFHLFTDTDPQPGYFTGIGNLYWNTGLKSQGAQAGALNRGKDGERTLSLDELAELGYALQFIYADPGLSLNEKGYTFSTNPNALGSAFKPFDASCAGSIPHQD